MIVGHLQTSKPSMRSTARGLGSVCAASMHQVGIAANIHVLDVARQLRALATFTNLLLDPKSEDTAP